MAITKTAKINTVKIPTFEKEGELVILSNRYRIQEVSLQIIVMETNGII